MAKNVIGVIFILFFVSYLGLTSSVLASHDKKVLGESSANLPQIPPTTDGPGLVLPDSPLYVLDHLKQTVRLFFAFTPSMKAKVYASIAGERTAELRFMLAKNNKMEAITSIKQIADNLEKASEQLALAQMGGANTKLVAKNINDAIKAKQQILDALQNQADEETVAYIRAAQHSLLSSKLIVEESIPADELDSEVREDLARKIQIDVQDAAVTAKKLRSDIDILNNQVSEAVAKSLKNREIALQKAIDERNNALAKLEQQALVEEQKKQQKVVAAHQASVASAQKALGEFEKAAGEFQKSQVAVDIIRNQTVAGASTSAK